MARLIGVGALVASEVFLLVPPLGGRRKGGGLPSGHWPVAWRVLALIPGNVADISLVAALFAAAGPVRRLIADKGYDAKHLRHLLAAVVTWWLD